MALHYLRNGMNYLTILSVPSELAMKLICLAAFILF